jgi:hypothetical protein|tara:strand:+ start:539 stop:712 length:174 start_codon:yes stop_codon:yes gene_type:complete
VINEVDRLCSRHIAKLLDRLENQLSIKDEQQIKRQFRFFADDVKQVKKSYNEKNNKR